MKLTLEARERIVNVLGASEASTHIAAVDSEEGVPPAFASPVRVQPHVLQWCIALGVPEDLARSLMRKANAQAEDFGLDAAATRELEREANAERQREYRERHGDDYRESKARYMRDYRKRRKP